MQYKTEREPSHLHYHWDMTAGAIHSYTTAATYFFIRNEPVEVFTLFPYKRPHAPTPDGRNALKFEKLLDPLLYTL